jgi:hypothetical protein
MPLRLRILRVLEWANLPFGQRFDLLKNLSLCRSDGKRGDRVLCPAHASVADRTLPVVKVDVNYSRQFPSLDTLAAQLVPQQTTTAVCLAKIAVLDLAKTKFVLLAWLLNFALGMRT